MEKELLTSFIDFFKLKLNWRPQGIKVTRLKMLSVSKGLGGLHLFKQLDVGSHDLSQAGKKLTTYCLANLSKFTKWQLFSFKWSKVVILSNSCHEDCLGTAWGLPEDCQRYILGLAKKKFGKENKEIHKQGRNTALCTCLESFALLLQPLKEKFSKDTATTISLDFADGYVWSEERAGCDILPHTNRPQTKKEK